MHLHVVGMVEVAGLKYWFIKRIPTPQLDETPAAKGDFVRLLFPTWTLVW